MNFRIANAINKMRFIPRQEVNLNINPNNAEFAPQAQKAVKVQMAKAKHNLRKSFAQKPDEFTQTQTPEVETVPTRIKELSKLPKHKRSLKVAIPKKHKTPKKQKTLFEKDMQEISIPFISEEEQQWIDIALRNHNVEWDYTYKPIEEHYKAEIEHYGSKHLSKIKDIKESYAKATQTKTKIYFDNIKSD